jgi:PKD repeat protein
MVRKKILFILICSIFTHLSLHTQVVLANFETGGATPTFTPLNVVVTDNPDKIGNTSNKVGYFKKPVGNWKAFNLSFSQPLNIRKNTLLKFKLRVGGVGRVYVKIWHGSTVVSEGWSPNYNFMPPANVWTVCSYDVSTVQDREFTRLEINASVDNETEKDIYFDDFTLENPLFASGLPSADFKLSNNRAFVNDTLTFDASDSYDTDGRIVSFQWDFKDGTTDTGRIVKHRFTTDGIYSVALTLTDNDNKKSTITKEVYILVKNSKVGRLVFNNSTPSVNDRVEGVFLINATYNNNFDPDEVKIDAEITLPDQKKLVVPCFYYIKNIYDTLNARWLEDASRQYWVVRFSSQQVGVHKIVLKLTDAQGTVSGVETTISLKTGVKKGIIRPDAQNKQYYRHLTGEPFYPMGINAAWDNMANYQKIIINLSKGKANLMRYWHSAFSRQQLEWKNNGFNKGLGIYSQGAAAMQDSILDLCDAQDINLQMVFFHHGMFSETVNSNWNDNPYNVANGGFLTKSEEFFYNENAKIRTKKLIRYIVARWGYSPRVFAWELFNEVNFTGNNPNQSDKWTTAVINWHGEMAQYIKSIDPFNHIVTTSAADAQLVEMDNQNGLDNVQYHIYNANLLNEMNKQDAFFKGKMKNKSYSCGEYGQNLSTGDAPLDIHRVAIFGGIMTQTPRMMWLWDNFRNDTAWANSFKMPVDMLKNVDLVKDGNPTTWNFTASTMLRNFTTQGIKTDKNNFYGLITDANELNNIEGVSAKLQNIQNGTYRLTVYLPINNRTIVTDSLPLTTERSTLTLPAFSKALAFKLEFLRGELVNTSEIVNIEKLEAYPNPVSDALTIGFQATALPFANAQIIDAMGRIKHEMSLEIIPLQYNKISLLMRDYPLSNGVYFVKVAIGERVFMAKVVFQR